MNRVPTVGVLFCLLASAAGAQEPRDAYGDPLPKGAVARLGTTRWRNIGDRDRQHRPEIRFTPDGQAIVCSMPDHSLASFDASSGRELWRIGGMGQILDFVLTPDGKTLLTSETSEIRVWDVATRRETRSIDKLATGKLAVDGDYAALTGGYEGSVPIVNWKTGKLVQTLETHGRVEFRPALFLPDNKLAIVSQGADDGIEIFDHRSGKFMKFFKLPSWRSWLFPGNIAVSYFDEKAVRRWDVLTGKELPPLVGHGKEEVWCVAVTRDGKTLVAISLESIRRWDLGTGKETGRIRLNLEFEYPLALAFSDDGKRIALASTSKSNLRVFDFELGRELPQPMGHTERVDAVHFSQSGKTIVSDGGDGTSRIWDTKTGRQILKLGFVGYFDLKSDSFFVGRTVFDLRTGNKRFEIPLVDGPPNGVFVAGDRPVIALTKKLKEDGPTRIDLWDAGKQRWSMTRPWLREDQLRFSPGGRLLWIADTWLWVPAEERRLWSPSPDPKGPLAIDLATGFPRGMVQRPVASLAISPDGRSLAGHTPPGDWFEPHHLLTLIEAASGRERLRMDPGPPPDNFNFADPFPPVFSPDGRLIAVVFPEHCTTIMVFDTATGKRSHKFEGHALPVTCLEFSRDGSKLVSGSKDCTALVWDVSVPNRAGRAKPLSAAELDVCWKDLASDDARRAYRAIVSLRESGPHALELIRTRLKPEAINVKEIERQIGDLGSEDKAARERAQTSLQRIAPRIEQLLHEALKSQRVPEAQRRLEQLLKDIVCFESSPERLRELRCIEVLEGIGGDKARALLETHLEKTAGTRLGLEVRHTIERMKGR